MVSAAIKKGAVISTTNKVLKNQRDVLIAFKDSSIFTNKEKEILDQILVIYDEVILTIESNILSRNASNIPESYDAEYISFIVKTNLASIISEGVENKYPQTFFYEILDAINLIKIYLINFFTNQNILIEKNKIDSLVTEANIKFQSVNNLIEQNKLLSEDLRNKTIHQVYDEDSKKFKMAARLYEMAFYILLLLVAFYLFGYYFEVNTQYLTFKLAEHFDDSNKIAFYIQKVSLIILSSTLAAFLLKRSFMNRRLSDEAYRTAKEIDGLPRYMVGLPEEMKEKIRFDLAYKYFGNGIHHESYTGGENLMHENMKANTDFIMAVKDLNKPSDDKPNSDDK